MGSTTDVGPRGTTGSTKSELAKRSQTRSRRSGLCAGHETQIMEAAYGREVSMRTRTNRPMVRTLSN